MQKTFYKSFGKRVFDAVAAGGGLLALAVPIAAIGAAIRFTSGGPVFFRQQRVGKDGRMFETVKFRTMSTAQESDSTVTVAGDNRITPIGRVLRRYKLDELPQLINVLRGEMSFVGPRPDVPGYADVLEGPDRQILELRPGITGPATLAYRNEEELLAAADDPIKYNDEVIFPHKVKLNLEYLDDCSLTADLKYIFQTLSKGD